MVVFQMGTRRLDAVFLLLSYELVFDLSQLIVLSLVTCDLIGDFLVFVQQLNDCFTGQVLFVLFTLVLLLTLHSFCQLLQYFITILLTLLLKSLQRLLLQLVLCHLFLFPSENLLCFSQDVINSFG